MLRATGTTRLGFSLIELLVVISIITIVLALSFPMIADMRQSVSASSGANTIAITISSARRYATDPAFAFALSDVDPRPTTGSSEPGLYSGVAALFTPAGEIRLVKNFESARYLRSSSIYWYLERKGPRIADAQSLGQPQRELNGFVDIGIDYIQLGSDVGVVGITRNRLVSSSSAPLLIPPPFAIWFDQNGYMVATGQDTSVPGNPDNDNQFVYYDGDYDTSYDCFKNRYSEPYNPNEYNPNSGEFLPRNYNDALGKYLLPIEKIEAVIGLYVFSQAAFDEAVEDNLFPAWDNAQLSDNVKYWRWMQANGEMMLFSRQTGMLMRNRDE